MPNEANSLPNQPAAQTEPSAQPTPAEAVKPTGAVATGADTQAAPTEAQANITETPEFKAALTAAIEKKIPQLKKQIAKSISGEQDATPDAINLQQQLGETQDRLRNFEAKADVRSYLTDPKNKMNLPAQNLAGIEELVLTRLEYGDDDKPSNLKEAVESVKSLMPEAFAAKPSSINAGNGRTPMPASGNMNEWIRQQHAGRN